MEELKLKENYGTLSQTINALLELGYTHDFNQQEESVDGDKLNALSPDDFQIDHVYRFEGDTDPANQSILYAISSINHDLKGILVNGYGISFSRAAAKLVQGLETHYKEKILNYKSANATPLHPEGEWILNVPHVELDLNEYIDQLMNDAHWKNDDRNSITIFEAETMRIVLLGLHENAELKSHMTNGITSVQVLKGKIEFTSDQINTQLEKGQIVAFYENGLHCIKALSESSFCLLTLVMNSKPMSE